MIAKDISDLFRTAAVNWVDDYAQSMGAALAFYTIFSIAPLLLIVTSIAGLVFGRDAVHREIFIQLQALLGLPGATAVQGLLDGAADSSARSAIAPIFGLIVLFIGATSVFAELQDALDRIWRAPVRPKSAGLWRLLRARLLSFGMILGIAFLLTVSLAVSAGLSAVGRWLDPLAQGWATVANAVELGLGATLVTAVFAMIYKTMPRVGIDWTGRVGGSRGHFADVHRRQVPDRRLYRPQRHLVRLRRRGLTDRRAAVGLLLGPDLPVWRGVHLGLLAQVRLPPGAGPCATGDGVTSFGPAGRRCQGAPVCACR